MNQQNASRHRPFFKVGLCFIPLLICALAMTLIGPKGGSGGYSAKILHFEFARSFADISSLFTSLTTSQFKGMLYLNYIDYLFMIIYSVFLAWFSLVASRYFNFKPLILAIPIAILICLLDALENWKLIEIMNLWSFEVSRPEAYEKPLFWLQVFTWPKWLGIALILVLNAMALRRANQLGKILAIFLSIPIVLGCLALLFVNVFLTNLFGISIILCIASLVISCFWIK